MSVPFNLISSDDFLLYFVYRGIGAYYLILISGFVFGLWNVKKLSPAGRGIWLIVSISLFFELLGSCLAIAIETGAPGTHFVNLLHFVAYGYTFSKFIVNKRVANGFLWTGIILAGYALANLIWFQDIRENPSNTSSVGAVAFVFGSLVTFYNMMRRPSPTPLLKQGLFWFNTSTLFFYASTFFSFALQDHYLAQWHETGVYMPTWAVNLIRGMNYYLYVSLFIAMWLNMKRPTD
jgi:hypothetical protein